MELWPDGVVVGCWRLVEGDEGGVPGLTLGGGVEGFVVGYRGECRLVTPGSSNLVNNWLVMDTQSSSESSSELGMVWTSIVLSGCILLVKVPRYSTSGGEWRFENKVGVLSLWPKLGEVGEAVAPGLVDLGMEMLLIIVVF